MKKKTHTETQWDALGSSQTGVELADSESDD